MNKLTPYALLNSSVFEMAAEANPASAAAG